MGSQRADKAVLVIEQRSDARYELRGLFLRRLPEIVQVVQEAGDGLGARQARGRGVTVAETSRLLRAARVQRRKGHDGVARLAHRRDKILDSLRLKPSAELLLPRQEPARAQLEAGPLPLRHAGSQESVDSLAGEILDALAGLGQPAAAAGFFVVAGPASIRVLPGEEVPDTLRDLVRVPPAVDQRQRVQAMQAVLSPLDPPRRNEC